MKEDQIREILEDIQAKRLSVEEGISLLSHSSFTDLTYARVDHDRKRRQGIGEVVYAAGKTKEQILGIVENLVQNGAEDILITRLSPEKAGFLRGDFSIDYNELAQLAVIEKNVKKDLQGHIVVASGGTSDIPVCEEAVITAEVLGSKVTRLYDVGVAGLHRLLAHLDLLREARVIIAVAGMEGALPSVIGGLVDCPIIAVPTSVGYGANFGGMTALHAMLNSCASGLAVVNIDNGFGAGVIAHRINISGQK